MARSLCEGWDVREGGGEGVREGGGDDVMGGGSKHVRFAFGGSAGLIW